VQRPWHGFDPLTEADRSARGEAPWQTLSASAQAANPGWHVPLAITREGIKRSLDDFAAATRRARLAGFRAMNVHGAHGYLIHSFLSPLSNLRDDEYGGSLENRMRYALEVADAVRSEWPAELPFFYRLSCVDDSEGGWTLGETVALAHAFARRGVDVVDCSSGGLGRRTTTAVVKREPGYQVPYAERVKRETGLQTMAVGLIRERISSRSAARRCSTRTGRPRRRSRSPAPTGTTIGRRPMAGG
jgi:2,4-dienoyl-CoA reductase-like NADH-dependent reductase (Old Yellow Enzyme family)